MDQVKKAVWKREEAVVDFARVYGSCQKKRGKKGEMFEETRKLTS